MKQNKIIKYVCQDEKKSNPKKEASCDRSDARTKKNRRGEKRERNGTEKNAGKTMGTVGRRAVYGYEGTLFLLHTFRQNTPGKKNKDRDQTENGKKVCRPSYDNSSAWNNFDPSSLDPII